MTQIAKAREAKRPLRKRLVFFLRRDWMAWLIMLPGLFLFAYFVWIPIFQGLVLSLFQTKGYDPVAFVGLQNYRDIINDRAFVSAFTNSFKYLGWSLLIGFLVPIAVAILINEVTRGGSLIRVSIYFPTMVPGVAVALMWKFLLDPGPGGVINAILNVLGLPMSAMLTNPSLTIPLIVMTMTWKGFGGTAIIYLASLQGVNQEMYEASVVDGAGVFKRIWNIGIPTIMPLISLMFIMQIIGVFQVLYEPLMMTDGGPNNASISLLLLGYHYGFRYMKAGHSMAVSTITFLILMVLVSVYFYLDKRNERYQL